MGGRRRRAGLVQVYGLERQELQLPATALESRAGGRGEAGAVVPVTAATSTAIAVAMDSQAHAQT